MPHAARREAMRTALGTAAGRRNGWLLYWIGNRYATPLELAAGAADYLGNLCLYTDDASLPRWAQ